MFYVFNQKGECILFCDNAPDEKDLMLRGEKAIETTQHFQQPWLKEGKIIEQGYRPSVYHQWNGEKWALNKTQQANLLTEQQTQVRSKINAKRDSCVNGGVYVPKIGKWVDTDEKGRATLVEIKADFDLNGKTEENGEPRIFTLICADNTAEPLDFDKFKAVWNAAKTLKEKMFENAYMHKILLEQAENPLEYDWSIGWSQTYEEYQNEQEKSL